MHFCRKESTVFFRFSREALDPQWLKFLISFHISEPGLPETGPLRSPPAERMPSHFVFNFNILPSPLPQIVMGSRTLPGCSAATSSAPSVKSLSLLTRAYLNAREGVWGAKCPNAISCREEIRPKWLWPALSWMCSFSSEMSFGRTMKNKFELCSICDLMSLWAPGQTFWEASLALLHQQYSLGKLLYLLGPQFPYL